MKRIILSLWIIIIVYIISGPGSAFAGADHDRICKYRNGMYTMGPTTGQYLNVNYPGYYTKVLNVVKNQGKLYYVVNASSPQDGNYKEFAFYSFDCRTKKPSLIEMLGSTADGHIMSEIQNFEIDALDSTFYVVRGHLNEGRYFMILGKHKTKEVLWNNIVQEYYSELQLYPHTYADNLGGIRPIEYLDFKPSGIGRGKVLVRLNFNDGYMKEKWFYYNFYTMTIWPVNP